MTAKLTPQLDQDVSMTTARDESVAEAGESPMDLESNEQLKDDPESRFVTLTSSRKMHNAEGEPIVRMPL